MKTLTANGEQIQATRVVKRTDSITCYDANNNVIAEFRGISDFAGYSLDGEYDTEVNVEQEIADLWYTIMMEV